LMTDACVVLTSTVAAAVTAPTVKPRGPSADLSLADVAASATAFAFAEETVAVVSTATDAASSRRRVEVSVTDVMVREPVVIDRA